MSTPASTCAAAAAAGLVFFSVCFLSAAPAAALFFNYTSFSRADVDRGALRVEGDADVDNQDGLIDVTANKITGIGNSVGRASYSGEPVLLWDRSTGEVASFATGFSFVIDYGLATLSLNNKGTGMAFFLAGYPSSLPADSGGYKMGLTNQRADATAAGDSRFVAVEFDTFNDTIALDPNGTYDHIGVDVNSVRSVTTKSLPNFNLQGNMTAEIKYDNVSSVLEVTLWLHGGGAITSYSISHTVDLKSSLPESVAVGFSASTTTSTELHRLRSWWFSSSLQPKAAPPPPLPPPVPPPNSAPGSTGVGRGGAVAGATVGAALFLVLLFAAAALFARRRRSKQRRQEEPDLENDGDGEPMDIEMGTTGPRPFPYHELVDATRGFAAEEKLGQGGFGSVYRGYLRELGLAVAIKRFARGSSSQGRKEYQSEIRVISRLRHRNLVQLVGWCHGRDELLLVYELVPNRSLDVHLHGDGTFLTWPMRVKIVLGLGSALLYLHEEWEQCVVHRDVKPSNVMVDELFNAKLGDFGLARFIDHAVGTQTMTAVSGTPGYVDPECLVTGRASAESDVYSFGVVVLELACGRRPMSLLDGRKGAVFRLVPWAWDLHGRGAALDAADERLAGNYDAAEMARVVAVGLWCAHPDPRARPSIRAAVAALQAVDGAPLPELPARMPVPTYAPPVVTLPELQLFSAPSTTTATTSSGLTQTSPSTATTSRSGFDGTDASGSSSSTGSKDSSSLLKHQY